MQTQNISKNCFQLKQQKQLRKVQKLQEEKSNQIIKCQHIISNYSEEYAINMAAYYVPYNFMYEDKGWGCAWRAIQMVLSAYFEQIPNFIQLFEKYSRKKYLINIVKKKKLLDQNQSLYKSLIQSNFAPECQENNWAQPYICKLVCEDKNIKNKVFLVNGYPHANAPEFVFEEVVDFMKFIEIVKQNIECGPIMIDDGYLAMTILGFKEQSQNSFHLIIGDPHIINNKTVKQAGIYEVVFNKKGKQIQHNFSAEQQSVGYLEAVGQIDFQVKKWMGLYTYGLKE